MEDGRWVTINGAHVFVKDGQSPMDAFIRQKTISKSKRNKNIVYEEKYKNADIQILITKKGYTYKTKLDGEKKFFYDEGYDYDFKQQAIDEARKSIDRRS